MGVLNEGICSVLGGGSLSGFSGVEGLVVAGTLGLSALVAPPLPFREALSLRSSGISEYHKYIKK